MKAAGNDCDDLVLVRLGSFRESTTYMAHLGWEALERRVDVDSGRCVVHAICDQ